MDDSARWFWISWYANGEPFELHTPWWVSGERDHDGAQMVCAAITATDEDDARQKVRAAHDVPPADLEWRFCEERRNLSPFNSRFRRAPWMKWDEVPRE